MRPDPSDLALAIIGTAGSVMALVMGYHILTAILAWISGFLAGSWLLEWVDARTRGTGGWRG